MVVYTNTLVAVVAACMIPFGTTSLVPPANLPDEYRRTDNRFMWSKAKTVRHDCTYPHDSYNACEALDKANYTKDIQLYQGQVMKCGVCMKAPDSSTFGWFCSETLLNGSWHVVNVQYTDEACTKTEPWDGVYTSYPSDNPPSCSQKCSPFEPGQCGHTVWCKMDSQLYGHCTSACPWVSGAEHVVASQTGFSLEEHDAKRAAKHVVV
eukprot:TRINITY_DN4396_c0_g1_i1.p1 TRINITY_DN4396_c0_g1~~TRINITY_DN4396_c0_g1_i1.p1  ORF type:complete len:208 (-),score=15.60 TRINITY_DN4396_c0_g1_i1:63-686(-)